MKTTFTKEDILNDPTFQAFEEKKKGRRASTISGYFHSMKSFCNFVGKSPTDIHDICISDLRNRVPEFDQWLPDALEEYVSHLIGLDYKASTIRKQITNIKSFLHAFRIKPTPDIEISKKRIKEDPKYRLKVEDIRKAIKYSDPIYQTFFTVQAQTGLSLSDVLLLDVGDFISSISKKSEELTIKEAVYRAKTDDNLVGCFDLRRKKTSNNFYTFVHPEALRSIALLLEDRDEYLTDDSPIFLKDISRLPKKLREKGFTKEDLRLTPQAVKNYVNRLHAVKKVFPKIIVDDKPSNYFRTHKLRSWYSNQLRLTKLRWEDIKFLMGQTTGDVLERYIDINSYILLKENYRKAMPSLAINDEIVMEENHEAIERLTRELEKNKKKSEIKDKEMAEVKKKQELLERMVQELMEQQMGND